MKKKRCRSWFNRIKHFHLCRIIYIISIFFLIHLRNKATQLGSEVSWSQSCETLVVWLWKHLLSSKWQLKPWDSGWKLWKIQWVGHLFTTLNVSELHVIDSWSAHMAGGWTYSHTTGLFQWQNSSDSLFDQLETGEKTVKTFKNMFIYFYVADVLDFQHS